MRGWRNGAGGSCPGSRYNWSSSRAWVNKPHSVRLCTLLKLATAVYKKIERDDNGVSSWGGEREGHQKFIRSSR